MVIRDGDRLPARVEDTLFFAREGEPTAAEGRGAAWKVIIADDEEEVHGLTRLVLDSFTFEGRGLRLLSAYSGAETRRLMEEHPDTAILLLDVVMEEDDAGLSAIRYIREELGNRFVRIILRTGQPGQAPEQEVVTAYDINDYKAKTELTAQKLFTSLTAALRAFRDIRELDSNREGLTRIIASTREMLELRTQRRFAGRVLAHLNALLSPVDVLAPSLHSFSFAARRNRRQLLLTAGTGQYSSCAGVDASVVLPASVRAEVDEVCADGRSRLTDHCYIGWFPCAGGDDHLVYFRSFDPFTELDRDLISIFATIVAVGFENLGLSEEIVDTQRAVIGTLGEVVELRSLETAEHTQRVGRMSALLGRLAGLPDDEAQLLRLAAPMHDVGKIGIPDSVLKKAGPLTAQEMDLMKTHTTLGHTMLRKSNRPIMRTAATIAHQHHERWDGRGYPRGLAGEQIDLAGRITGLADAFDAMSSHRVYRQARNREAVLATIVDERGAQFDPALVDLMVENIEAFDGLIARVKREATAC